MEKNQEYFSSVSDDTLVSSQVHRSGNSDDRSMSSSRPVSSSQQETAVPLHQDEKCSECGSVSSRLCSCSPTSDTIMAKTQQQQQFGGSSDSSVGESDDTAMDIGNNSSTNNGTNKGQPLENPGEWIVKFKEMCFDNIFEPSIKGLDELMQFYVDHVSADVKSCYMKPNRAAKLKKSLIDVLTFFYIHYSDLKPVENSFYLNKMSDLLSFYMDMEIKASRRGKESVKKICSKLITSLYLFLDKSVDHILDAILNSKLVIKSFREICIPILRRVLDDIPSSRSLMSTTNSYKNIMTYVRYVLTYKLWKRIVRGADQRRRINALAISQLRPVPANLREVVKTGVLNGILIAIPKSKPDVTQFLMQAKFNVKDTTQKFLKLVKKSRQFELLTDSDRCSFFSDDPICDTNNANVDNKSSDSVGQNVDVGINGDTTVNKDFKPLSEISDISLNSQNTSNSPIYSLIDDIISDVRKSHHARHYGHSRSNRHRSRNNNCNPTNNHSINIRIDDIPKKKNKSRPFIDKPLRKEVVKKPLPQKGNHINTNIPSTPCTSDEDNKADDLKRLNSVNKIFKRKLNSKSKDVNKNRNNNVPVQELSSICVPITDKQRNVVKMADKKDDPINTEENSLRTEVHVNLNNKNVRIGVNNFDDNNNRDKNRLSNNEIVGGRSIDNSDENYRNNNSVVGGRSVPAVLTSPPFIPSQQLTSCVVNNETKTNVATVNNIDIACAVNNTVVESVKIKVEPVEEVDKPVDSCSQPLTSNEPQKSFDNSNSNCNNENFVAADANIIIKQDPENNVNITPTFLQPRPTLLFRDHVNLMGTSSMGTMTHSLGIDEELSEKMKTVLFLNKNDGNSSGSKAPCPTVNNKRVNCFTRDAVFNTKSFAVRTTSVGSSDKTITLLRARLATYVKSLKKENQSSCDVPFLGSNKPYQINHTGPSIGNSEARQPSSSLGNSKTYHLSCVGSSSGNSEVYQPSSSLGNGKTYQLSCAGSSSGNSEASQPSSSLGNSKTYQLSCAGSSSGNSEAYQPNSVDYTKTFQPNMLNPILSPSNSKSCGQGDVFVGLSLKTPMISKRDVSLVQDDRNKRQYVGGNYNNNLINEILKRHAKVVNPDDNFPSSRVEEILQKHCDFICQKTDEVNVEHSHFNKNESPFNCYNERHEKNIMSLCDDLVNNASHSGQPVTGLDLSQKKLPESSSLKIHGSIISDNVRSPYSNANTSNLIVKSWPNDKLVSDMPSSYEEGSLPTCNFNSNKHLSNIFISDSPSSNQDRSSPTCDSLANISNNLETSENIYNAEGNVKEVGNVQEDSEKCPSQNKIPTSENSSTITHDQQEYAVGHDLLHGPEIQRDIKSISKSYCKAVNKLNGSVEKALSFLCVCDSNHSSKSDYSPVAQDNCCVRQTDPKYNENDMNESAKNISVNKGGLLDNRLADKQADASRLVMRVEPYTLQSFSRSSSSCKVINSSNVSDCDSSSKNTISHVHKDSAELHVKDSLCDKDRDLQGINDNYSEQTKQKRIVDGLSVSHSLSKNLSESVFDSTKKAVTNDNSKSGTERDSISMKKPMSGHQSETICQESYPNGKLIIDEEHHDCDVNVNEDAVDKDLHDDHDSNANEDDISQDISNLVMDISAVAQEIEVTSEPKDEGSLFITEDSTVNSISGCDTLQSDKNICSADNKENETTQEQTRKVDIQPEQMPLPVLQENEKKVPSIKIKIIQNKSGVQTESSCNETSSKGNSESLFICEGTTKSKRAKSKRKHRDREHHSSRHRSRTVSREDSEHDQESLPTPPDNITESVESDVNAKQLSPEELSDSRGPVSEVKNMNTAEADKLHTATCEMDRTLCMSQFKFRDFYSQSYDVSPSIPVPYPPHAQLTEPGLENPPDRCPCVQCSENLSILIANYKKLTQYRNARLKDDVEYRKHQDEALIRQIERSMNEKSNTNNKLNTSRCGAVSSLSSLDQDCSLPLKKRKTLTHLVTENICDSNTVLKEQENISVNTHADRKSSLQDRIEKPSLPDKIEKPPFPDKIEKQSLPDKIENLEQPMQQSRRRHRHHHHRHHRDNGVCEVRVTLPNHNYYNYKKEIVYRLPGS